MDDAVTIGFEDQLELPTPILDFFPKLAIVLEPEDVPADIRGCLGARPRRAHGIVQPINSRFLFPMVLGSSRAQLSKMYT
jgi:hypothetical protein